MCDHSCDRRSEEVPDLQGKLCQRPPAGHEEQGELYNSTPASLTLIVAVANAAQTLCVCVCVTTEAPLPRAAKGGAGHLGRGAGRICQLLHLAVSTVTAPHPQCFAHLCP